MWSCSTLFVRASSSASALERLPAASTVRPYSGPNLSARTRVRRRRSAMAIASTTRRTTPATTAAVIWEFVIGSSFSLGPVTDGANGVPRAALSCLRRGHGYHSKVRQGPLVLLVPSLGAAMVIPRGLVSTGLAVACLYLLPLSDLARAIAEPALL